MPGKNKPLLRYLEINFKKLIRQKYSALLLGARQVGKTTLIHHILKIVKDYQQYPLQNPSVRQELEKNPGKLINQIEALNKISYTFIDEAQKIPALFDAVQYLIDNKTCSFILTGSSATKLRRSGTNLLPGRLKYFQLTPLLWGELGFLKGNSIAELSLKNINKTQNYSFEDTMVFGALPKIALLPLKDREDFLRTYTYVYLEEEIRAEALSRKIGSFAKFLEIAAVESGSNPNFSKLSQETGVSLPAIKEFFQILEDTLIVERIEPYLKNARKRILSSPKYYFFDLGVRNALARLPLTKELINSQKGLLFEHAVILELSRRIKTLNLPYKLYYWKTKGGAEVDCIIDFGNKLLPIEIKSAEHVSAGELKGLKIFLQDYQSLCPDGGLVITQSHRKEKINSNITMVPWDQL